VAGVCGVRSLTLASCHAWHALRRQVYLDCETEAAEISNSRDMVRLMVRLTAILLEAVSTTSSEGYARSAVQRNEPL